MVDCKIVDTFPTFLSLWDEIQNRSIDMQIEAWIERYMSTYPELLQQQLDDYADLNEDWRATAKDRIFPALPERLSAMQTAHDNLLEICDDIYGRCRKMTGFDKELVCVIYFGLGCGAGWATEYRGKPAILFGLENIAEESWQEKTALEGLMAHELGHLVHFEWRKEAQIENEDNYWWQLYTEGFAMHVESMILGKASWHMQDESKTGWQDWCQENLFWLAAEFLRRIDLDEGMRPFFGSWLDLRGYKQTGYFLGHEIIKKMQEQMSLREIAVITDIESHSRPLLEQMTEKQSI